MPDTLASKMATHAPSNKRSKLEKSIEDELQAFMAQAVRLVRFSKVAEASDEDLAAPDFFKLKTLCALDSFFPELKISETAKRAGLTQKRLRELRKTEQYDACMNELVETCQQLLQDPSMQDLSERVEGTMGRNLLDMAFFGAHPRERHKATDEFIGRLSSKKAREGGHVNVYLTADTMELIANTQKELKSIGAGMKEAGGDHVIDAGKIPLPERSRS